jgi:Fe-S-cluster containining protein
MRSDPDGDLLEGTIELRVGRQSARLKAAVPRGDVPVAAVIPVARQMTEAVVSWAVADTEASGKRISCRAGCGACCRQPVPIGHAEARRLSALVDGLPEPRRSRVRARFGQALARLRETDSLQRLADLAKPDKPEGPDHYFDWAMRYFQLGIACPFLEEESCSIHPERPLICREYLVTNSASECANPSRDKIQRVPVKARVSKAVRELGQEDKSSNFVVLAMALEWTAAHPAETNRQPALDWIRRLQQLLGRKSEASVEPDVAPSDYREFPAA